MNIKKLKKEIKKFFNRSTHKRYWYGFFYFHKSVNEKIVLLESFHGKNVGDSPLECAREIERLYPGKYKLYFATNNVKEHKKVIDNIGINAELIDIDSIRYLKILASAKYIISNASLPIYFVRKENQVYLQTWHGTPLKTLGKQMREGIESMNNVQHNFLQASHILFPNEFTRDTILRDYNLLKLYSGKVIMSGYPRNRVFFDDEHKRHIRKKLGLESATLYAYMPTWRGTSNETIDNVGYFSEVKAFFKKIDRVLKADQFLYVNFHPILASDFSYEGYEHIRPFPEGVATYDFLSCTDALITDYSSVFFDYSITGNPITLFIYDYDRYMHDRGMYLDLKELPFRKIFDIEEMIEFISNSACDTCDYKQTDYCSTYLRYDSPSSTNDLVRYIFEEEVGAIEVKDFSYNENIVKKIYRPKQLRSRGELQALAAAAGGDDSVAFLYRKWFKNEIGQVIHDEYNSSFDYLILTDKPPRTYTLQLLSHIGVKRARRRIKMLDVNWCLGHPSGEAAIISDYGFIDNGFRVKTNGIKLLNASCSIHETDHKIVICSDSFDDLKPKERIILDSNYVIVAQEKLTQEEIQTNRFEYTFTKAIETYQVYYKEYGIPGLICKDAEGNKIVALFTNEEKSCQTESAPETAQKRIRAFEPAFVEMHLPVDYERGNIKKILLSPNKETRELINGLNMKIEAKTMALVPSLVTADGRDFIGVYVSTENRAINYISDYADCRKVRIRNNYLEVTAFMGGWNPEEINGAHLTLEPTNEGVTIPGEVSIKQHKHGCEVVFKLKIDEHLPFAPIRWQLGFDVHFWGKTYYERVKCRRRSKFDLKTHNIIAELPDDKVFMPYVTWGNILNFYYRNKTEYDNYKTIAKEIVAMFILAIAKPVLVRKKFYIIFEKFCKTAQDNSYYFFKYCMEQLPKAERKKYFYIIDKNAPDYKNVKKYDEQIIQFMSIKHMVYSMCAKLFISTDSTTHLYAWESRPSFINYRIHKKDILFLQHGVTALKRVDQLFGKHGSSPMTYFVTTSEKEQHIVVNEFGYNVKNAPIVGFTRWDVLEDKKEREHPFILVMPTWRSWLEDATEEDFLKSDYYKNYYELLTNERLNILLKRENLALKMYLHPKFAQYISTFGNIDLERIECIPFGQEPLNELMMRCSMLVTDYSSVCWDVLYMDKPVAFYQFDSDQYLEVHGSYIDLESELPSPRTTLLSELIDYIEDYIVRDFKIQDEYLEPLKEFFLYRDNNNCERTYRFLKRQTK